jgi:hypothetical protein
MMDSMQPMAGPPAPAPAPMPPLATTRPAYVPPAPISGGVKALLVIISIVLCPVGSIIAWVYGARNADRPGASLVRLVGLVFTVLSLMGGLVFSAAVLMIPDLLAKGQDGFHTPPPAAGASSTAVQMEAGQPQGLDQAPPAITAKIAELRTTVAEAVQTYFKDKGKYPTLAELNKAGLLDERFKADPAHPEPNYLVQVVPWAAEGKPGCNVNVKYTGPEAQGQVGTAASKQAKAAADATKEAAGSAGQAAPAQRKGSGQRGAERWKQYL